MIGAFTLGRRDVPDNSFKGESTVIVGISSNCSLNDIMNLCWLHFQRKVAIPVGYLDKFFLNSVKWCSSNAALHLAGIARSLEAFRLPTKMFGAPCHPASRDTMCAGKISKILA